MSQQQHGFVAWEPGYGSPEVMTDLARDRVMSRVRRSKHTPAANGSKWIRAATRWAIYLRDNFACVYCEVGGATNGHTLTLDHIKSVEDGGGHNPENLVTCCLSCNSAKQSLSQRQWFARLRERGIETVAMRHRISRCRKRQLDRQRGRFLAATREKHTESPQ